MKKFFVLICFLLLTGCAEGVDKVKTGMTTDEVIEVLGEPSIDMEGLAAQIVTEETMLDYREAAEDEKHVINTDRKLKREGKKFFKAMESLLQKRDQGEIIEMYFYEVESEFGNYVQIFFSNDEVVVVDKVSSETF